jgi:tetratricopeptide (TPR) repeat protein
LIAAMTAFLFTFTPTLLMQSAVLRVNPFGRMIDFMGKKYQTFIEKSTRNDVHFCAERISSLFGFTMDSLERHDLLHLNAAEGWLGLGNSAEAADELAQITPAMRSHPDVLTMRCEICAQAKRWEECAEAAETILKIGPKNSFALMRRSFALHELKRTQEALEKLLPAVDLFPKVIVIPYNVACYECVLGNMEQAKRWLSEAFNLAHKQKCFAAWRSQALDDPDLEPLREYLKQVEI